MLFKPEHIEMIKKGNKTATRRRWERWQVKEGGIYPIQTKLFQKKSEAHGKIKVKERYKEELGSMTEEDASKEGYDSLEYFREIWEEINDTDWDPHEEVFVVEFKYLNNGEQKTLGEVEER